MRLHKVKRDFGYDINIAPLIDVVFLLIVFFLTVSHIAQVRVEALSLPEAQQEIMQATPAWVTAAFALAVFGGTLGSILLLMRKKLAVPVFGISLGSIIAQMGYGLGIAKSYEVFGAQAFILPIILIVIGVFLYMYSKKQREAGLLI